MSLQPAYKHIDEIGLWNDRAQQLECVSVVKEGRDVATFTFRAAEEGWLIAFPHDAHTAWSRIRREGNTYTLDSPGETA